jgi:hypothetical protein
MRTDRALPFGVPEAGAPGGAEGRLSSLSLSRTLIIHPFTQSVSRIYLHIILINPSQTQKKTALISGPSHEFLMLAGRCFVLRRLDWRMFSGMPVPGVVADRHLLDKIRPQCKFCGRPFQAYSVFSLRVKGDGTFPANRPFPCKGL